MTSIFRGRLFSGGKGATAISTEPFTLIVFDMASLTDNSLLLKFFDPTWDRMSLLKILFLKNLETKLEGPEAKKSWRNLM